MSNCKTAFCRNVGDIIKALGLNHVALYTTAVDYGGRLTKVSKKTIESIVYAKCEPRRDTKAVLVKVLETQRPGLRGRIPIPELESASFDYKKALTDAEVPRGEERFAVDPLIVKLQHIVDKSLNWVEVVNGILGIPIEDAKAEFWKGIRAILEKLGIEDADFSAALRCGGIPPELPIVVPGKTTLAYAERILANPGILTREQQLVWKVACTVYPPHTHRGDPDLKKAARYLAKYWDRAVLFTKERWRFSPEPDLVERRPQEKTQVYLLSWLELPLVTQTGNADAGKTGLFSLGRHFQKSSS